MVTEREKDEDKLRKNRPRLLLLLENIRPGQTSRVRLGDQWRHLPIVEGGNRDRVTMHQEDQKQNGQRAAAPTIMRAGKTKCRFGRKRG